MVLFSLSSLLLLSFAEAVTASVLLGQQRWSPNDGATKLALDKRQGTTSFITFSTIYLGGNASRTRKALSGYDIRVDVANSAWGFCATNNPDQCDMAGICVDSFTCSNGCGFGNTALKTWTCSNSNARYCSTALLTVSSDSPRAVTYLACADKPDRTQEYMAFTTAAATSVAITAEAVPLPTARSQETGQTTIAGTSPSETAVRSVPTSSVTDFGNIISNNNDNTTNTAMIVGATVGCVALICICVVVIFLLRRSRSASAAAAGPTTTTATADAATGGGGGGSSEGTAVGPVKLDSRPPLAEAPNGSHAMYQIGSGEVAEVWGRGWGMGTGHTAAPPAELSGSGVWDR